MSLIILMAGCRVEHTHSSALRGNCSVDWHCSFLVWGGGGGESQPQINHAEPDLSHGIPRRVEDNYCTVTSGAGGEDEYELKALVRAAACHARSASWGSLDQKSSLIIILAW